MIDTANAGWVLPEELQQLALGGDRDVIAELVALFKKDVAARMLSLREAVMAGDIAGVAAHARTIKGSAIQIGAVNLVTTCRHLELDAAHHVSANLERLLLEAETEFDLLKSMMQV